VRRIVLPIALTLVLALTACSGDGDDKAATDRGTTTSTSTASTSSTTGGSTSTTGSCPTVGTTATKDSPRPAVDQLLSDVTTATDGCTDTITFAFQANAASMPGYQVEYADPPFTNSAGQAVTPAGTAFLKVRFVPAWIADLNQESAPLTYTGPRSITPTGLRTVRGLELYDATEAVVSWVVGLDAKRPFTVDGSSAQVVIRVG
jgi:hypothetical protein